MQAGRQTFESISTLNAASSSTCINQHLPSRSLLLISVRSQVCSHSGCIVGSTRSPAKTQTVSNWIDCLIMMTPQSEQASVDLLQSRALGCTEVRSGKVRVHVCACLCMCVDSGGLCGQSDAAAGRRLFDIKLMNFINGTIHQNFRAKKVEKTNKGAKHVKRMLSVHSTESSSLFRLQGLPVVFSFSESSTKLTFPSR